MLRQVTDHAWRSTYKNDWPFVVSLYVARRHLLPSMCQISHMHSPVLHMKMLLRSTFPSSTRDEVPNIKGSCNSAHITPVTHQLDPHDYRVWRSQGGFHTLPRDLLHASSSSTLKASSSLLLAEYSNVAAAFTPLFSKLGTCSCHDQGPYRSAQARPCRCSMQSWQDRL